MRAQFRFAPAVPGIVAIVDANAGAMSVTNDAEAVVWELYKTGKMKGSDRLIYRDTDGQWDELQHNGAGAFTGYGHLGCRQLADAIKKLTKGNHNGS